MNNVKENHIDINKILILIKCFFPTAVSGEPGIATAQDVTNVEGFVDKVQAIREVLKRDHMKVAFFGRWDSSSS